MEKEKAIQIRENLRKVLTQSKFKKILPELFYQNKPFNFDLSVNNPKLSKMDMSTPKQFMDYIKDTLSQASLIWGLGGYGEKRDFYQASLNFIDTEEARDIHLGLDLWLPAHTEIYAPLSGTVHSFQDNNNFLDYGPAIILEHKINDVIFYTLYGHLSRESLTPLHEGMIVNAGDKIATVGFETENGSWPTHLHFQIIGDMLGKKGDYPGVSSRKDSDVYLNICPNPDLIFKSLE